MAIRQLAGLVVLCLYFFAPTNVLAAEIPDPRFPLEAQTRTLSKQDFHALLQNNSERLNGLRFELQDHGFEPSFVNLRLTERTTKAELERIARQAVVLDELLTAILSFENFRLKPDELITGLEAQRNGQYFQVARIIEKVLAPPSPARSSETVAPPSNPTPTASPAAPSPVGTAVALPAPIPSLLHPDIGLILCVTLLLLLMVQYTYLKRQIARNNYLIDVVAHFKEKLYMTRFARDELIREAKDVRNKGSADRIPTLTAELEAARVENQKLRERNDRLSGTVGVLGGQLLGLKPMVSFLPLADRAEDFDRLEPPLQMAIGALIRCLTEKQINDILKFQLAPLSRFEVTVHDQRPKRENLLWVIIGNIRHRLSYADNG